jgi:hypothetical protein
MTHNTPKTSTVKMLIGLIAAAAFVLAPAAFAGQDMVTLCHNTGSETNPWEIITVSRNSWEHDLHANGHALHGDHEVAEGTTADQCEVSCSGEGCSSGGSGGA